MSDLGPTFPLPRVVLLRNRTLGQVRLIAEADHAPFTMIGSIEREPGIVHAWTPAGRWLDTPARHALDIVGVQADDGKIYAFHAAAGANPQ